MTSSVRSPLRSRRALVATVVPMRTASTGSGEPSSSVADARDCRVGVAGRVVREQLVREQTAVRASRDDVGEGAASVDPELPACHVSTPLPRCSQRPEAVDHVAQNTLVRQLGRGYGPVHMDEFRVHEVPDEDAYHSDRAGRVRRRVRRPTAGRHGTVRRCPRVPGTAWGPLPDRPRAVPRRPPRSGRGGAGPHWWCGRASWRTDGRPVRLRRRTSGFFPDRQRSCHPTTRPRADRCAGRNPDARRPA